MTTHLSSDLGSELKWLVLPSGPQSVVPGPTVLGAVGSLLEIQILRRTQDLVNQKAGGRSPAIQVLRSPPINSDAARV